MAEKVTFMELEVDLQCPCCYKKVKKLLCKFPQIRDQVYEEKKNTVTITVICCSPEKIRDKLCCKGGKVIKSIKIITPPKPKPPEKPPAEKPAPKPAPPLPAPKAPEPAPKAPEPAPKAPEPAPKPAPKPPEPAPEAADPEPRVVDLPRPRVPEPAPKAPQPAPAPPQPVPTMPVAPGYGCPSIFPYPFEACCGPCSEGRGGGPCYHGYGRPQPCYCGCGYGPYCRGKRPYYVSRCDEFLNDENPSACTIM